MECKMLMHETEKQLKSYAHIYTIDTYTPKWAEKSMGTHTYTFRK